MDTWNGRWRIEYRTVTRDSIETRRIKRVVLTNRSEWLRE
jgi:hypothetical protein